MNDEIEKRLWKRVNTYLSILQIVPFVKMVAICNNLAFGKVQKSSDIDLFIIAEKGRLFFVRIFITFLLHFLGVRRHGDKVSARFCLSFFVDDSHLNLSKIALKNDIYLAYWIKSMIPVIEESDTLNNFKKQNQWATELFKNPNDFYKNNKKILKSSTLNSFLNFFFSFLFNGLIGNFIENILMKWQLKRAKKKLLTSSTINSNIIIEPNILKFHKIDRRNEYKNKWTQKYSDNLLITDKAFLNL